MRGCLRFALCALSGCDSVGFVCLAASFSAILVNLRIQRSSVEREMLRLLFSWAK